MYVLDVKITFLKYKIILGMLLEYITLPQKLQILQVNLMERLPRICVNRNGINLFRRKYFPVGEIFRF